MKTLLKVTLLLLFSFLSMACSSKKYYTLGDTSRVKVQRAYPANIGIKKVEIPRYLKDNSLVKQVTPYEVEIIENAHWLAPMQKHLTNVLISYLQNSLNNPNISLYPWESSKNIEKRISLKIKRFIAYKNQVFLEGSYQIDNLQTKNSTTKLFSKNISTQKNTEAIMKSMENLYFQLASEISFEISK